MIGRVTALFVAFGIFAGESFRCFSEYEFTWWDARGIEHVNGFSMSHFQLKMRSLLLEYETQRVPFREAFFLTKLHPSYQANLTDECPHAMIQANFLVSLFHGEAGNLSLALDYYSKALSIFNHAPVVHQQVSLLAWPFATLKMEVEARLQPRLSHGAIACNITIVAVVNADEPQIGSFLAEFGSILLQFEKRTLLIVSPSTGIADYPTNIDVVLRPLTTICEVYLSVLNELPVGEPVIFLNFKSPPLLNLVRVFLQYLLNTSLHSHFVYSFSNERSLRTSAFPGGYVGSSFGTFASAQSIHQCERLDEDIVWASVRRCDDESLPWSLRLCRGDEPFKTDWRDVLLSPVLPRKPVL